MASRSGIALAAEDFLVFWVDGKHLTLKGSCQKIGERTNTNGELFR